MHDAAPIIHVSNIVGCSLVLARILHDQISNLGKPQPSHAERYEHPQRGTLPKHDFGKTSNKHLPMRWMVLDEFDDFNHWPFRSMTVECAMVEAGRFVNQFPELSLHIH